MLCGDCSGSLFRPANGVITIRTPAGSEINLLRRFTELPAFPNLFLRLLLAAVDGRELPGTVLSSLEDPADREAVTECHRKFGGIIEKEGNSVWTWYITNVTGPEQLLVRKVNRIVANPP